MLPRDAQLTLSSKDMVWTSLVPAYATPRDLASLGYCGCS